MPTINFSQRHLNKNLIRFIENDRGSKLTTKERMAIERGCCHGYSVVHAYMHVTNNARWWKDALVALSGWDGSEPELLKRVVLTDADAGAPPLLKAILRRVADYVLSMQNGIFDTSYTSDFYKQGESQMPGRDCFRFKDELIKKLYYREEHDWTKEKLATFFDKDVFSQPAMFILSCPKHSVSIYFNKENEKWVLYDSNSSGYTTFFESSADLARAVVEKYGKNLMLFASTFSNNSTVDFQLNKVIKSKANLERVLKGNDWNAIMKCIVFDQRAVGIFNALVQQCVGYDKSLLKADRRGNAVLSIKRKVNGIEKSLFECLWKEALDSNKLYELVSSDSLSLLQQQDKAMFGELLQRCRYQQVLLNKVAQVIKRIGTVIKAATIGDSSRSCSSNAALFLELSKVDCLSSVHTNVCKQVASGIENLHDLYLLWAAFGRDEHAVLLIKKVIETAGLDVNSLVVTDDCKNVSDFDGFVGDAVGLFSVKKLIEVVKEAGVKSSELKGQAVNMIMIGYNLSKSMGSVVWIEKELQFLLDFAQPSQISVVYEDLLASDPLLFARLMFEDIAERNADPYKCFHVKRLDSLLLYMMNDGAKDDPLDLKAAFTVLAELQPKALVAWVCKLGLSAFDSNAYDGYQSCWKEYSMSDLAKLLDPVVSDLKTALLDGDNYDQLQQSELISLGQCLLSGITGTYAPVRFAGMGNAWRMQVLGIVKQGLVANINSTGRAPTVSERKILQYQRMIVGRLFGGKTSSEKRLLKPVPVAQDDATGYSVRTPG